MRISIIGAGIGGLTAALALRQFGFEPEVFEQAPHLLEVGAAILMWPNAMRVFARLGVAEAVRSHGAELQKAIWLDRAGDKLNQFQLPTTRTPAIALHRADLQTILLSALPAESIHLGHSFTSYEQQLEGIVAHFSNGSSVECDLLIAADGIHSRARAQFLNDGLPTDHDYIAWRGVTPHAPKSLPSASAIEIHGAGRRFGIGPLGNGKVGWWASVNKTLERSTAQSAPTITEHTSQHSAVGGAARAQLMQLLEGWCEPVNELIQMTPLTALVHNSVLDRPPVRQWGAKSLILIGDAIHPVTPNLGQGGCLAIEDAAVLARCLKQYAANDSPASIEMAMRKFAGLRYRRTATVTRLSRIYGMIGQWDKTWAVGVRRILLSNIPAQLAARLLSSMFDYDAYSLDI